MRRIAEAIDYFQDALGRSLSWLTAAMVAATVVVVTLRYGFGIGAIALQESVIYMNALVFLAGAAWTLKENRHVRVDIVYSKLSPRRQQLVNLIGHLALLAPMCVAVLVWSFDWVLASWRIREGSPEVGGIPAVFLLKTMILLMPILLLAQIVSECIKIGLALRSDD
ncbi:MAG: TRAP transporter small permease subunit [Gammaproteobacteria bacterium]|nr:TRAP transporter small permease subunit [Gammaproteobacteria bacterium]